MIRAKGRRCNLSLGMSVLNGEFDYHPQIFLITSCLGNVTTDFFWDRPRRGDLGVIIVIFLFCDKKP